MLWCAILLAGLAFPPQGTKATPASSQDGAGVALLARGNLSGAEAAFRRDLQTDPEDVEALNDLGVILRRKGEPHEAVELFRRAVGRL